MSGVEGAQGSSFFASWRTKWLWKTAEVLCALQKATKVGERLCVNRPEGVLRIDKGMPQRNMVWPRDELHGNVDTQGVSIVINANNWRPDSTASLPNTPCSIIGCWASKNIGSILEPEKKKKKGKKSPKWMHLNLKYINILLRNSNTCENGIY